MDPQWESFLWWVTKIKISNGIMISAIAIELTITGGMGNGGISAPKSPEEPCYVRDP